MTITTQEPIKAGISANWLPLTAICLGYFLVILDVTVVSVAIPTIGTDLHTGFTALQWVVDGYTLAFAGLLLLCGGLNDRLGGKPVFLAGLSTFTVASIGCGLAPFVEVLIAFRLMQGIGAALMVPASLALLRNSYPDPGSRARAFGIWGMVAGIAAGSGPVLGGVLVSVVNWPAIFFVNIPFGVLGFFLTKKYVPSVASVRNAGSWDIPAQLLGVLCLGGLTMALIEAGAQGWNSPVVIAGFCLFAVALPAFLLAERRAQTPMMPLSLFNKLRFSASAIIGVLLNFGFYGLLFIVPIYFQRTQHLSPLITGLAMLPMAMMPFIASPLSGRFAARKGAAMPMVVGLIIGGIGLFSWLLINSSASYWALILPLALTGFGIGFTMPAATMAIMDAAPAKLSGAASAIFNTARQTGSAIGVALAGTLLASMQFIDGLHVNVIFGGIAFLLAATLTRFAIRA